MSAISKIKLGSVTYDIDDKSKLPLGDDNCSVSLSSAGLHVTSSNRQETTTVGTSYLQVWCDSDEYDIYIDPHKIIRHQDFGTDATEYTWPTTGGEFLTRNSVTNATLAGPIKVSSVNTSAVIVNSESTTSGRYYPIELNTDGKAIVNVPWSNTTYSKATNTSLGLIKPWRHTTGASTYNGGSTAPSASTSAPNISTITATTGRYYAIETDVNGRAFVNVPWTNTDTKVSYTSTTTDSSYPLLFKYSTGSTTTAAGTRFSTSITANPSTGTITATKFVGDGSGLTEISKITCEGDNRSVATTPNDYFDTLQFKGIKSNSIIGDPSSDNYSFLFGLRGWHDTTGGQAHEFAFNDSGMYHRQGLSTSWGSWEAFAVRGNRNMYEHLVSLTLGDSSAGYLKGTGTLQFRVITHRPASFITSVDAIHTLLQEAGNYLPCYCSYYITSNSSSNTYIGQSAYCYALLRVAGSDSYFLNCSGTYIKSNVPYIIGMTLDYMISAVKVLKTIQL